MLVTEEEAKTKWCPHTRQVVGQHHEGGAIDIYRNVAAHNAIFLIDQGGLGLTQASGCGEILLKCIAAGCMAWRWNEAPGPRHPDDNREQDNRGFCGLAGKP